MLVWIILVRMKLGCHTFEKWIEEKPNKSDDSKLTRKYYFAKWTRCSSENVLISISSNFRNWRWSLCDKQMRTYKMLTDKMITICRCCIFNWMNISKAQTNRGRRLFQSRQRNCWIALAKLKFGGKQFSRKYLIQRSNRAWWKWRRMSYQKRLWKWSKSSQQMVSCLWCLSIKTPE